MDQNKLIACKDCKFCQGSATAHYCNYPGFDFSPYYGSTDYAMPSPVRSLTELNSDGKCSKFSAREVERNE